MKEMHTPIHSLITRLSLAMAVLLMPLIVQAGYIVTLAQQGADVVATATGAIDLTGLTLLLANGHGSSFIIPDTGEIVTGPTTDSSADFYTGAFNGPSNFGTGGFTFASTGSGDIVGINPHLRFFVLVPHGYTSGNLSDSSTYSNVTFRDLGVRGGIYEWR